MRNMRQNCQNWRYSRTLRSVWAGYSGLAGHSGLFRPDTPVGPDTSVGMSRTLRRGFSARVLERKSSPSGLKSARNWPNQAGETQDKAGPTP